MNRAAPACFAHPDPGRANDIADAFMVVVVENT
ncbi:hypothetical protein M2315_002810 [Agrobacterium fabrum]|nr:hypothetical protein [Agrobacterium fabrum]